MKDPLYQAIQEGLASEVSSDAFEDCAADLLAPHYPGLAPIRGGNDAGMDGAIPREGGPPLPLVTTTGADAIGNLTKNLKRYLQEGGEARETVFATNRVLSPQRRRNLEKRAKELGFVLRNIHDGTHFLHLLYRDAVWRQRLLGLTGDPLALSTLPRSPRLLFSQPILGREDELARLSEVSTDAVIFGQPGSGKTALLQELALRGEGRFVVTEDMGRIANEIRRHGVPRLFLDDAHRRKKLLVDLRDLRDELGAAFIIVATSWPGDRELSSVCRSLGVPRDAAIQVGPLPRKVVADIVAVAGLAGPRELIGEILDQARGKPGLAVSLSRLCLNGGVEEVVLGRALVSDAYDALTGLAGTAFVPVLAAFALGGSEGMPLDLVAECLGLDAARLWDDVTQIEAGGVLEQNRGGSLTVQPAALREALVATVFFSGARSLRIDPFLRVLPNAAATAIVLIRARQRRAEVPDDLIRSLLVRLPIETGLSTKELNAWVLYAWTGESAVKWILQQHPGLLEDIAHAGLERAPDVVLPLLLTAAKGDERELNGHPEHPVRQIRDWIRRGRPGSLEAVGRRARLLRGIEQWKDSSDADPQVVRKVAPIVFDPEYENSPWDPIEPNLLVLTSAHLTAAELAELMRLWPSAVALLTSAGLRELSVLEDAVGRWAFPGRIPNVSDAAHSAAREGATRMLQDLGVLLAGRPGARAWVERIATRAKLDVSLPGEPDPDYEVLFPAERPQPNWSELEEKWSRDVEVLAARWARMDPSVIAGRISYLDEEGFLAGARWPRLVDAVAHAIERQVDDRVSWISALIKARAAPDVVSPFLAGLLRTDVTRVDLVTTLYEDERYHRHVIAHLLTAERVPAKLLERALQDVSDLGTKWLEMLCLRGEIPEDRLQALLTDGRRETVEAVAQGMWRRWHRKGSVEIAERTRDLWKRAVVAAVTDEVVLGEIASADPKIAEAWIEARFRDADASDWSTKEAAEALVSALDPTARRRLLHAAPEDVRMPGVLRALVGRDPDLYRVLLSRRDLSRWHLSPLQGMPDNSWPDMAALALDSGHEAAAVMQAARYGIWVIHGPESPHWKEWRDAFSVLHDHHDPRIREVSQIGQEWAATEERGARESERREEIFGVEW